MGSLLSLPNRNTQAGEHRDSCQTEACKRMRMSSSSSFIDENPRLIPSLPDEISLQILARVPKVCYLSMKLVSRTWKAAVASHEVFQLRKELGTTEEWLYILTKVVEEDKGSRKKVKVDKLLWYALDPLSRKWQRLPPMPDFVDEEEANRGFSGSWMRKAMGSSLKFADVIRGWLGQKDSLERVPFCGCGIGAVDGCLYVLGGFSKVSAMKCVWRYDPCCNLWQEVSPMTTGRAFCKTTLLNNKLYVVGGVSRGTNGLSPLQSGEVFDPHTGLWTQMPNMPFSKAWAIPTAFLAEILKPIATGMTSYRGRLCVPQSLYAWPFFVDAGGEIYDSEMGCWLDMPTGMGDGWPARQAGAKLSVVVNGELYALDPSSTSDSVVKVYDHQEDAWKVVIKKVPVHDSADSDAPYLIAGFLGKLHVITKDANDDTAILQADLQKHKFLIPTTSSTPAANSMHENQDPLEEADVWKVIAAKNLGAAELVSCQVVEI